MRWRLCPFFVSSLGSTRIRQHSDTAAAIANSCPVGRGVWQASRPVNARYHPPSSKTSGHGIPASKSLSDVTRLPSVDHVAMNVADSRFVTKLIYRSQSSCSTAHPRVIAAMPACHFHLALSTRLQALRLVDRDRDRTHASIALFERCRYRATDCRSCQPCSRHRRAKAFHREHLRHIVRSRRTPSEPSRIHSDPAGVLLTLASVALWRSSNF
jgi:hypothetical protein